MIKIPNIAVMKWNLRPPTCCNYDDSLLLSSWFSYPCTGARVVFPKFFNWNGTLPWLVPDWYFRRCQWDDLATYFKSNRWLWRSITVLGLFNHWRCRKCAYVSYSVFNTCFQYVYCIHFVSFRNIRRAFCNILLQYGTMVRVRLCNFGVYVFNKKDK